MQYFLCAQNYFCVAERIPVNHSSRCGPAVCFTNQQP